MTSKPKIVKVQEKSLFACPIWDNEEGETYDMWVKKVTYSDGSIKHYIRHIKWYADIDDESWSDTGWKEQNEDYADNVW